MKRIFISILFAAACSVFAYAHIKLTGTIIDKNNSEPLIGAIVSLDGTSASAVTDTDGKYALSLPNPGSYSISASLVGYLPVHKKVKLTDKTTSIVDIVMDENPTLLDEVVVTANRNAVKRSQAPVVVNILNHKLFESVNSTDLAQTLNYQSGLRVENNCQNCGFPQVRINGLEGPYSQILINSRPVVSSLSGVYALEQMPVNMIERIEVVRGGGSALFGANAVGGTINVITRDPITDHFEVGTTISCMNGKSWEQAANANASMIGKDGKYGLALYESYRHRSPYDANGDGFSEIGKLKLNTFGINGYYRLSDTRRISIEYHNTTEFRRGGNKFDLEPFQTDITEQTRHDINSGGINYTQSWREYSWRMNLYASAQHIDRNSYYGAQQNPDAYGKTDDMTWVAGGTVSADFNKVIFSPATFMAGIEYQSNSLHDVMTGYNRDMKQDVDIFGAFVQNEWKWKWLTILAGIRVDNHNLIDNPIVSPRANILYRPMDALQARLTYSTGFRAPQAYDEDLHVTAVGGEGVLIKLAEGLKPEKSNSFSGSVDWDYHSGIFGIDVLVEGFYTELNNVFVLDAIGSDNQGNTIKIRRNGSGAKVYGANIDVKLNYGNMLNLQLGFTGQRSRYNRPESWSENPEAQPTRVMPRSPDYYGYFTLGGQLWNDFNWSVSGVYTGPMSVPHYAPDHNEIPDGYPYHYIAGDELKRTGHFMEIGIKLCYDLHISGKLKAQICCGIQNIGNAFQKDLDRGAYRDSGYFYGPTQPRTYFIGLKFIG